MAEECRYYFSTALPSELLCKHIYGEVFTQAECQMWLTVIPYILYVQLFVLFHLFSYIILCLL